MTGISFRYFNRPYNVNVFCVLLKFFYNIDKHDSQLTRAYFLAILTPRITLQRLLNERSNHKAGDKPESLF